VVLAALPAFRALATAAAATPRASPGLGVIPMKSP
jgi:hypothetical protein